MNPHEFFALICNPDVGEYELSKVTQIIVEDSTPQQLELFLNELEWERKLWHEYKFHSNFQVLFEDWKQYTDNEEGLRDEDWGSDGPPAEPTIEEAESLTRFSPYRYEWVIKLLESLNSRKEGKATNSGHAQADGATAMLLNEGVECWRILREELIAKGLCRSEDNILIWLSDAKALAYFAYCLTRTVPFETRRKMGLTKGQQTAWLAFETFMNLTPGERRSKIAPWVTRIANGDDPLAPADADTIKFVIEKSVQ